ncbi:DNA mismatch repair ATPase MutS [Filimonas zeae]|uniref:DNA mismatch repair protein MutS n=1 Tax=Filimonas zeae TaxID=1737353 RepID=A0A917J2I8_9BACT|nr:DNA mismatch repair protein MutS [Filimonas zeae]MDR6341952.1 DNA mismatch repair ATPase MutS [Filimonas zeae]GGH79700.1 DNA mismatch repair protein MutS [Filimonas zeae]
MLKYAIIALSGIVILLFWRSWYRKKQITRLKTKMQLRWGEVQYSDPPFHLVETYSLAITSPAEQIITPHQFADLDLNAAFEYVDRTITRPGQQYLYHLIRQPSHDPAVLEERDQQACFFITNTALREEIQLLLHPLSDNDAYFVTSLLEQKLAERPSYLKWLPVSVTAVILILLLAPWYHPLLLWLFIPLPLNLFVHLKNKSNLHRFTRSFPQLNQMIRIADKLSTHPIPFPTVQTQSAISALKSFRKKFAILNAGQLSGNPMIDEMSQLTAYLFELLRAFFLVEIHTFFSLIRELENKREDILALYQLIGSVDTALSIASLRSGEVTWCRPQFTQSAKALQAKNMHHPLISNCVPNSLLIQNKSILLTGSNMSGKTTFLRALGLNIIFAQSINTCFAEEMQLPVAAHLYSSIRIDDDLQEGKSYYFEEVNIMSGLIHEVRPNRQNIFILDEVFKGTNTIERIAAGKAILSWLNRYNNVVLVATHDVELTDMLETEYDLYHFTETIQNDQLHFDHLIKKGPLTTRNAIKILEMTGYPSAIIDEASAISQQLIIQKEKHQKG